MSMCWRSSSAGPTHLLSARLPILHSPCLMQQRIYLANPSSPISSPSLSPSHACVCSLPYLPYCVRAPAGHRYGVDASGMEGGSPAENTELQAASRDRKGVTSRAMESSAKGSLIEAEGSPQGLLHNAKEMVEIENADGVAEEVLWGECMGGDEAESEAEVVEKDDNCFKFKLKPNKAFNRASSRSNREQFSQSEKSSKYKEFHANPMQEEDISQAFPRGPARTGCSQGSQSTIEKTRAIVSEDSKSSKVSASEIEASFGAPDVEDAVEVPRLIVNLDLKLYQARRFRQFGRFEKAELLLRQCIKIWPYDGRAYVTLGKILTKGKRFEEARKVYEEGCQVFQGENAYIWQAWAVLEVQTGNIAKGRQLFDAAIAADKKHAPSWHAWAVLELRLGRIKKARSLIQNGLKFCGPNEYFYQTLACVAVKDKRYDQARSLFMKATQFNPKSAASWMAWGLLEMDHGVAETARQLFQRGIRASPKNRYIFQAWARFEAKQGNIDRARDLFKQGVVLNPQDPVMLQSFALFEYDCSNTLIARELFIRASKVDPSHQPVWIAWGWMEWKEKNLNAARKLFQKSIHVNSTNMNSVRAFQLWGVLEGGDGNPGKARALFRRALSIDSQNYPTWTSWVLLEEQQGNAVRADELRNFYFQQRTEVVDEAPWENFTEMLFPAIDGIKKFLKLGMASPTGNEEYYMGTVEPRKA